MNWYVVLFLFVGLVSLLVAWAIFRFMRAGRNAGNINDRISTISFND